MKNLIDKNIVFVPLSEYRNYFNIVVVWNTDNDARINLVLKVLTDIFCNIKSA
jgi:hypothetical protein